MSVLWAGRKPGKPWLPSDRLLAVALTLHDGSICPGCGCYKDETYGRDNGTHVVRSTVCAGCAALDRHHGTDDKPAPGEKAWVESETTYELAPGEIGPGEQSAMTTGLGVGRG